MFSLGSSLGSLCAFGPFGPFGPPVHQKALRLPLPWRRETLSDTRLLLGLAEPASNQVEEVETRRSIHTICTYLSQVITCIKCLSMHINAVKLPVSIL